jgi:hypothetical protein
VAERVFIPPTETPIPARVTGKQFDYEFCLIGFSSSLSDLGVNMA